MYQRNVEQLQKKHFSWFFGIKESESGIWFTVVWTGVLYSKIQYGPQAKLIILKIW